MLRKRRQFVTDSHVLFLPVPRPLHARPTCPIIWLCAKTNIKHAHVITGKLEKCIRTCSWDIAAVNLAKSHGAIPWPNASTKRSTIITTGRQDPKPQELLSTLEECKKLGGDSELHRSAKPEWVCVGLNFCWRSLPSTHKISSNKSPTPRSTTARERAPSWCTNRKHGNRSRV